MNGAVFADYGNYGDYDYNQNHEKLYGENIFIAPHGYDEYHQYQQLDQYPGDQHYALYLPMILVALCLLVLIWLIISAVISGISGCYCYFFGRYTAQNEEKEYGISKHRVDQDDERKGDEKLNLQMV